MNQNSKIDKKNSAADLPQEPEQAVFDGETEENESEELGDTIQSWLKAHMRRDASLTVERVITRSGAGRSATGWCGGAEPDTKEEIYFHLSRKQNFSEICVSMALWELEKNLGGLPWEEAELLLAGELRKAGLLAGNAVFSEKRQEQKIPSGFHLPVTMGNSEEDIAAERKIRKPLTADDYKKQLTESQQELFEKLRTLRREIAESKSVAQYIIFGNRSLAAMCVKLPGTMEELRALPGVGPKNSAMYGEQFLTAVREWAAQKA